MSRGHGKWERLILQQLEKCEAFDLMDLLADPKEAFDVMRERDVEVWNVRSNSSVATLRRAAGNLINAGKIDFWYDWTAITSSLSHGLLHSVKRYCTKRHSSESTSGRPPMRGLFIFPALSALGRLRGHLLALVVVDSEDQIQ